jgi:hypothetical protein
MGKGFGIAAMVVVFFSYGIPFIGAYVTFIGLLLATVAALGGDKPFTIAAAALGAVKLYLITPTWLIVMKQSSGFATLTLVMVALPIAALILRQVMSNPSTTRVE